MPKKPLALSARNNQAVSKAEPLLDKISNSWRQIEEFFRNSGILRGATYPFGDMFAHPDTEEGFMGTRFIGIRKVKGAWHVCYGTWQDGCRDDDITWWPIGECSSEIRIELLDYVGKLQEELVKSNEAYVASIEKAAAKAVSVVTKLQISNL